MNRTLKGFVAAGILAFSATLVAQQGAPDIAYDSTDLLKWDDSHVVGGLQIGQIVVVETHAAALEILDLIGDVLHLEGEDSVGALRALFCRHERERGARPGLQKVVAARLVA